MRRGRERDRRSRRHQEARKPARARGARPAEAPGDHRGLREDIDCQDAIALSLLVAILEAADIAFHAVADEGWGAPASYGEAFELLARHAVIDPDLAQQMTLAAGLRNRIAHGTASVDVERLWAEIPSGLETLERYAAAIARLVDAAPG